jgi:hypothetical protein
MAKYFERTIFIALILGALLGTGYGYWLDRQETCYADDVTCGRTVGR